MADENAADTPDGKPDPVKKALSDVMRKREVEKQKMEQEQILGKAVPGWTHPIVTRGVAGTDIAMGGTLYAPVKNNP